MSPAERKFAEYMQRGDDFYKVEILRPARNWYKRALEMNIETEKVKQKIAECNKQLAFEEKVIRILVAVVAILVAVYFIF